MKPQPALFLFSLLYGAVVWIRNMFFDIGLFRTIDVGVPVVSVGNITVGGTGKTPIVKNAAEIFLAAKKKTAIISRGYGRKSKGTVIVSDGSAILTDANTGGDEPLLLAKKLPSAIVIADEDRVRGARKAIDEFGAEVIILDDGFQHRRIKRTKDIVVIDSRQLPFDTGLLPAGYRREMNGSLNRADAIVLSKCDDLLKAAEMLKDERFESVRIKFSGSFRATGMRHPFSGVNQSLEILREHSAVAFCGIAKPEQFRKTLEQCGVSVKEFFEFNDHHSFSTEEMEMILRSFHSHKTDFILTTEKDSARLSEFEDQLKSLPVSAVLMDAEIHQREQWERFILSVFAS